ncbi:MAG: nucleotide sugar dehydrogenase [Firmicutes bacterium]|nr:nucleotide sugar dehydrogenase [Bacillota bacterium]
MDLYNGLVSKQEKLSVIGLGYVGMPLAVAFARKLAVTGFDINESKLNKYRQGIDITGEIGNDALKDSPIFFTSDEKDLREARFHIVAVPTPVTAEKSPDLSPVIGASRTVGRNLQKGSIVVYESTVYPGVTEEVCVPVLEQESGLTCGTDFKVGYSPERINPGDRVHRLENIIKIVSGMDEDSLETIAKVYELVVEAGVYRAESIKVAEAAKAIENAQRDINIAFINELAMVFNRMGIDTQSVLRAAGTKWNFMNFKPGLVGGHCIGVDPYYFIYKAEQLGYHSQIILAGRKLNDDMGRYVAENTVKQLIMADKKVKGSQVAVLGITFKENCPDFRNTKVIDIIQCLQEYGIKVTVTDPAADPAEVFQEYGVSLDSLGSIRNMDAVVLAVAHDIYTRLSFADLQRMYREPPYALIDVKGIYDKRQALMNGFNYWRL